MYVANMSKLNRLCNNNKLIIAYIWFLDDDIDLNNLPDDDLELYFNKLVPHAMQRGQVEGQEIPAAVSPS